VATTVACDGSIINEADATTGWSTGAVVTSDPDPVELTGCMSVQVSTATVRPYLTVTANYSAKVLIQWYTHRAALDSLANGGIGVYASDGTNTIVFHVAGKDRAVFRHDDGPALFQAVAIDTDNPPTTYTTVAGSKANLNWAAITQIGWQFKTLAKSIGGAVNCFWDIMRSFSAGQGLTITGGSSGTPGNFVDVASADRDTASQKAFGCLRTLGVGLYSAQASLNFGATGSSSWFTEDGFALVFEDRGYASGKLKMTMVGGRATYENHLVLKNGSIKSAASVLAIDFSAANVDEIDLSNTVVETKNGAITCATDSYAIAGHVYDGAVFRGCGMLTFGQCSFVGASVLVSAVAADASASKWNVSADPDGELDNMTFTKGTNAHHAIEFGTSSATTVTLRGWTTSGFNASDAQNDSTFYFADRGSNTVWTVNVIGGDGNFTYKKARSGDTVSIVIDPVTATFKAQNADGGAAIQGVRVLVWAASGGSGSMKADAAITSITRLTGVATVTTTANHNLVDGDVVLIEDTTNQPLEVEYCGPKTVTVTGTATFTFVVAGTPTTPATGTFVFSEVIINNALTDANGEVSDSRTYSADQLVTGIAAKASFAPTYKTANISTTLPSASDSTTTIPMTTDD
jgi:hypothetical protein